MMDPEEIQAGAERDQFWAALRQLREGIGRLAEGEFNGSEHERKLVQLLAAAVGAELDFRSQDKP